MDTELIHLNGINGATGTYLLPPLTPRQVAKLAQGEEFDDTFLNELKQKDLQVKGLDAHFAPIAGVDPKNLAETGWGVIFAFDAEAKGANPAIKEALQELLTHRQRQATQKNEHYYREFVYRPGESKNRFLARNGAAPGPVDPDKMPCYLLIVGDPATIPYSFQYQLDVQYAVGRIHFETIAEYAQYAHSVVVAETDEFMLPRSASFFGVRNSGDAATQLSADHLIQPLAEWLAQDQPEWQVQTQLRDAATKFQLGQLLGGIETPAFLLTGSHGMFFPKDDPRQRPHQGALLCQDWPGPLQWQGAIPEDFYFSADDVSKDARLHGLIAFHFACYGAGTPEMDEFAHLQRDQRSAIAPHAFVAHLPQRLLSHPKGGALAIVGHVERAWGCSFVWERTGKQLAVFQSMLRRLFDGHPIGSAVEYFNERYAELSSDLSTELENIKYGALVNEQSLASLWTANNDARSYAIIGDPAVRLRVDGGRVDGGVRQQIQALSLPAIQTEEVSAPQPDPESRLEPVQIRLTQALEEFVNAVGQAPPEQKKQLKLAISAATTLLEVLREYV